MARWLAALPGVLLLLASALADIIGFGAPGFGANQAAGIIAGLITIASWYTWNRRVQNDPARPDVARLLWSAAVLFALPLLLFGSFLLASSQLRGHWRDANIPWQIAAPESEGLDASKLDLLRDQLAARSTSSLLIVRNGRIVYEWYGERAGAGILQSTASLQKSIAGGMALVVALNDDRIGLDQLASRYISSWRGVSLRSQITIRQLATHTSGIEDAVEPGVQKDALTGWKLAFWSSHRNRDLNPFAIVLEHARPRFVPGTKFAYSSTGFALLGYAITASLRGLPVQGIRGLLRDRIMEPIGVPADAWSLGYDAGYRLDGLQLHPIWGGGSYTARAVARVGQLMLNRGRWNGEPLVSPHAVESVIGYAGTPIPDRVSDPHHPATTAA